MKKKPIQYSPEFKAKVVKEFIKADKTQSEICSQYEITTKSLQRWHFEYLEGIDAIFTKGKVEKAHKEELSEKQKALDEAYREIGSLTTQLNWLKKNVSNLELSIKQTMIDKESREMSIKQQCKLVSVSRSSVYYRCGRRILHIFR